MCRRILCLGDVMLCRPSCKQSLLHEAQDLAPAVRSRVTQMLMRFHIRVAANHD